MKRLFLGLAFGLALLLSPQRAIGAQRAESQQYPPYGYVMGAAREFLSSKWDTTNAYQVERIYQVSKDSWYEGDPDQSGHRLVIVTEIVPCEVIYATPFKIKSKCPDPTAPTIHVHTPTSCDTAGACALGGYQAFDPNPSVSDRKVLAMTGAAYSVVQSDRNTFTFYFPTEVPAQVVVDRGLTRDLFLTSLAGGVVANALWGFDVDSGGYAPRLDQMSAFHFTAGYALESLGDALEVPLGWRLGGVCGAAVAWEYSQGFVDWTDAGLSCGGALVSAGVRWAVRKAF